MELLLSDIQSKINADGRCFVRYSELVRVWPGLNEYDRESAVHAFAREHGWRVFAYSRALGAMFVAEGPVEVPHPR